MFIMSFMQAGIFSKTWMCFLFSQQAFCWPEWQWLIGQPGRFSSQWFIRQKFPRRLAHGSRGTLTCEQRHIPPLLEAPKTHSSRVSRFCFPFSLLIHVWLLVIHFDFFITFFCLWILPKNSSSLYTRWQRHSLLKSLCGTVANAGLGSRALH